MKTATTYTPDHYGMYYELDEVKKSFRQYKLKTFQKIAFSELIRTEKNNGYNSTTGAENLLKIRDTTNWSKCTISGLRPTGTKGFFYADLPIKGKKSLFVAYIPEDWGWIYIRICPMFYPFVPTERTRIINTIIQRMVTDLTKGNKI